jgi:hypothetical protein
MMKDMLMNYDTMSGGKGDVPAWKGAGIVYDRARMILGHLRKNGYGVGRHPIYKEMTPFSATFAFSPRSN